MYIYKYWVIFKSYLASSIEYRGALFTWILFELVSLSSVLFLWSAIFRTNTNVAGYDISKIVYYFLLVPIIATFTSVYVSEHLPRKIKDGEISTDLVKPYNFAAGVFFSNVTSKMTQFTIKIPIYLIVGSILVYSFNIKISVFSILAALVVCIFSLMLHFLMDLSLSYTAFWFDSIWALTLFKYMLLMTLGGQTFPLDLVPSNIRFFFNLFPFRFIYYVPVKMAQGGYTFSSFMPEFIQLMLWILFFYLLSQLLWKKGLKKYGAYGN